jgi:predicted permease
MWTWPWRRRRLDEETRAEFDAHLELLTDRYVRAGMTPDQARAQARRQFGNATWHREEIHARSGVAWIDGLIQDLKYALRQLRRSPSYFAVIVGTLALGIGGTTAVFSAWHAVLLAPLPFARPGQLVRLYQQEPGKPATRRAFSAPQFRMLRDEAASFTAIGARYVREDLGLDIAEGGGPAERLRVLAVTSDYFPTLAAGSLRGPGFAIEDEATPPWREEDRVGAHRVVLSDALWRRRFHGDASVIGTTIRLSGEPYDVAGIAPAEFEDPIVGAVDAWLPYDLKDDTLSENNSLLVFGRLRTGLDLERARPELELFGQSAKQRWPEARASSIVAVPLHRDLVATSRTLLQLLAIAVGLVLLVACVNVANLILVRASARTQEFAVRVAIGCGRARLARQLMVETLLAAGLGGLAALALAWGGVLVLQSLGRDALPRLHALSFDPAVLVFAAVMTIGTAMACGLIPAVRLARSDPNQALMQQSRSATGSRRQGTLRTSLAAAQLALALTLLAGAAVLASSFYRLMNVDLGFRLDRVLTFEVALPGVRYDAARRAQFQEELARRLGAIPGVTAAGGTSRLPATGSFQTWPVAIETGPLAATSVRQPEQPEHRTVSGEFFKALAIPVVAGRVFDDRDDDTPLRAVVSANLAGITFPGVPLERVIGQRIRVLNRRGTREIIGVVGDVAVDAYGTPSGAVYSAHRQFAANRNWTLTQVVAADRLAESLLPDVRAIITTLDPELAIYRAAAMTDVVGRGVSRERFAFVLVSTFASVALILAGIGLYGVLAYAVRQRTPEIGIRIALGATTRDIRALVLRHALVVLTIGLAAGAAGAAVLGRWLTSLVFEVSPWDVRMLATAALVLTVAAWLAAWLPARRAATVNPKTAMQSAP